MRMTGDEDGQEFEVACVLDGLRLSLLPASGRGVGLSVQMDLDEAENLIAALEDEVAAARRREAQAGDEMRRITAAR